MACVLVEERIQRKSLRIFLACFFKGVTIDSLKPMLMMNGVLAAKKFSGRNEQNVAYNWLPPDGDYVPKTGHTIYSRF